MILVKLLSLSAGLLLRVSGSGFSGAGFCSTSSWVVVIVVVETDARWSPRTCHMSGSAVAGEDNTGSAVGGEVGVGKGSGSFFSTLDLQEVKVDQEH